MIDSRKAKLTVQLLYSFTAGLRQPAANQEGVTASPSNLFSMYLHVRCRLPVIVMLKSPLQLGELRRGAGCCVCVGWSLHPRRGSDKHLLTERNANRRRTAARRAGGSKRGKGEWRLLLLPHLLLVNHLLIRRSLQSFPEECSFSERRDKQVFRPLKSLNIQTDAVPTLNTPKLLLQASVGLKTRPSNLLVNEFTWKQLQKYRTVYSYTCIKVWWCVYFTQILN